jgi:hypothetical protein
MGYAEPKPHTVKLAHFRPRCASHPRHIWCYGGESEPEGLSAHGKRCCCMPGAEFGCAATFAIGWQTRPCICAKLL